MGKVRVVQCHKLLLAAANPVFKTIFYGPIVVAGDRVEIKETTYEAFSSLIKFFYDVPGYLPSDNDGQKLFDILTIAEKYHVHRLIEEVKVRIGEQVKKQEDTHLVEYVEEEVPQEPTTYQNKNLTNIFPTCGSKIVGQQSACEQQG